MKNAVVSKRKNKFNRFLHGIRRDYLLYLMILPGMVYVIIFKYIPMYGITIAFKDYSITSSISDAVWVGFDNFIDLFRRNAFQRAFYNNIIISLSKLLYL